MFSNCLQGEGYYAGHPAVFIRLGGCNLRCPGFGPNGCDSSFSVDVRLRKTWKQYELNELKLAINKLIPSYAESKAKPIIVFTGGEPTLYYEQLADLVTYYVTRDYVVQFETNATKLIDFNLHPIYKRVGFSMSVKLSNSGEPEHRRINLLAINAILQNTSNSFFKFVIAKDEDVVEATELLKEIPYYASVYLMPMGETKLELDMRSKLVYEAAVKYGFVYSPRLHIEMYNDEKGR